MMSEYQDKTIPSLAEKYKEYFKIGAAVTVKDLEGVHGEILVKHFNSLTPENDMKFERIHPDEHRYNFDAVDKMKEFAIKNNMKMRGHTFVWHNQTPEWVFKDREGNDVSRELLIERLREHIKTVCDRYRDIVYAWDVVNEAVEDKTEKLLRDSNWRRIIGDDYIKIAFEIAKEYAGEGKLFYNDYNNEMPYKLEKTYKLLKELIDKETPIDGIGIQAHWNIWDKNLIDNLKRAIEMYASLGLEIQITELDMSVFEFEDRRTDLLEPAEEMMELQAKVYEDVFKVFREYKGVITSVTFWGISDKHTWKDNFPVIGRKDWPLLFDVNGKPKEAFFRIVNF
nr:endo-1,4-beta-xylanase [Caldicellulosiruptor owensensis]